MAYSYVRYSGNGSTTNYTFSFPTLSTSHIKVRVNSILVTNWSFLNSSTIQFAVAPANSAVIEIRRETPKESTIVNFTDGSVLLERDLDLMATWQLYVAQETEDDLEDTLRTDSQGRFDALNKRIINVAAPVDAQDAVNKAYADDVIVQAAAAATAAGAIQVELAADEADDSAASAVAAAASATAAAGSASTATAQANASAASAVSAASSAASAAALLDNFDDRYLGPKATAPTLDNDGNALVIGALYFDTTSGKMRVFTSLGWTDTSSAAVASLVIYEYIATAGQTVFSGNDVNGVPLSYTVGSVLVTLNGSMLAPGDAYTASSGTSIVLVSPAEAGDELQFHAFNNFAVANTYTKAETDAAIGNSGFPSGTTMLFVQTAAPTGWTKSTTHDNKALRVVSGTAGSGGSAAFTTAFGTPSVSGSVSGTVGNHTLTIAQIPSHTHTNGGVFGGNASGMSADIPITSPSSTGAAGGGGAHNHSFSGSLASATAAINVAYVDVIIATRN